MEHNQLPSKRGTLQLIGYILLFVAAIFLVTAMEAPFYMVERGHDGEIHPDDSHIGAPWRYFGISVLWYTACGAAASGITALSVARWGPNP